MPIDPVAIKRETDIIEEFYCWHANIITIKRHKVLIFVNNRSRLVIIACHAKPSAFKNLGELLEEGIRKLFAALCINADVIDEYIKNAGPCRIASTGTKSQIGRMNLAAEEVNWYSIYFRKDTIFQTAVSVELACNPCTEGKSFFVPQEKLYEELCRTLGLQESEWDKVRSCKSYRLRVTIDLEKHNIYRIIEAPVYARFWQLHNAIQNAFGWFDYHLHMFIVYDGKVRERQKKEYYRYKESLVILDHRDLEADDYKWNEGQVVVTDRSLLLSDVFEKNEGCVYTYDFGVDWEHVITVEERINGGGSTGFRLLEMQGERPPEDVGGEDSFEEYLRIISDENDPEHESTLQWAELTKAESKTIEEINRKMETII